jgi:hypothetical protein
MCLQTDILRVKVGVIRQARKGRRINPMAGVAKAIYKRTPTPASMEGAMNK